MDKKVLYAIIYSLLAIAIAALGLVGVIVVKGHATEALNELILIASTVASGLIGFMTGDMVNSIGDK